MRDLGVRDGALAPVGRNLDVGLAVAATAALIAAAIVRPPAVCSLQGHASLFTFLAWLCGIAFLAAIGICLGSGRRSIAARIARLAKIAGLVLGLLVAFAVVVALLILSSFRLADSENETASADGSVLQDDLRNSASLEAYWLGAQFRDASVRRANSNDLTYVGGTGADRIEIEVLTQYGGTTDSDRADLVVLTTRGDAVLIRFRGRRHPDATLIAEARAAVQAIPLEVTYSGCSS
jgi:hypothetical protein